MQLSTRVQFSSLQFVCILKVIRAETQAELEIKDDQNMGGFDQLDT